MLDVRRVLWCVVAAGVLSAGVGAGIGVAGSEETVAAKATRLTAGLDARQEVPRPTGSLVEARGSFVATLERKGAAGTLTWRLTFRGLTGKAMAAHVHLAKRGKPGPVGLALCGPCRSGARGSVNAKGVAVRALLAGGAYVNVHTARNPAGEIRGQVKAGSTVAPPSTTTTTTSTTSTGDDPYP